MMAIRQYTRDELLHLRDSPLVQKPDNLPAIEQWIEYVFADRDSLEKLRIPHSESQQTQSVSTRRHPPSSKTGGGDASPMGNFSAGARPSLMSRATAGKNGDDISLGPPRTMFPSSRNTAKLADFGDRAATNSGDATPSEEQEAPRSRFFGERGSRKSMNEKESRDNRESWTSARERRPQVGDDEQRQEGRFGRRDKDQDGERRNGFGDKHDTRWGEKRQNGERTGGWRDRERDKRDKDWDRAGGNEKEPEWMDNPEPAGADSDLRNMGVARNQEEFQKWKDAMSGKKTQIEEPETAPVEPMPAKELVASKTIAPLKLEGISDKPFGGWADGRSSGSAPDSSSTPAKPAAAKSKGSRFASMFKESQPKEDAPPIEVPRAMNDSSNGSAEDEAGFNRILQMLGRTGVSQPQAAQEVPSSPPARLASNGTKQKSRFTGFFDQQPKSPDGLQSPPLESLNPNSGDMFQMSRGVAEEQGGMFGGRLQDNQHAQQASRNQMSGSVMSPDLPTNGNREQQVSSGRANEIFLDQQQPPSRGADTPDVNIQNLLASQRAQKAQGQDKNSEFLLNLLQTKGSRPPSHQAGGGDFSLWLDQPPNMSEPHAPKPRAPPPPGFIDDHLLRNAQPDPPRQEQPIPGNEMLQRRTSQRAPPGFFDEQLFMQQQQRAAQQGRNFTEPPLQHPGPGRRMSGHPNMPQMPPQPHVHTSFGAPPPDFANMQSPLGGPGQQGPPPPGFNPHMVRHPPGFHPNMFSGPQRGDMPGGAGGYPPAAGPGSDPRMVAGPGGPPPNAPPGFFGGPQGMQHGPPGFIQMRSPTEGIPAGAAGGMRPSGGRGYDGGYDSSGLGTQRR